MVECMRNTACEPKTNADRIRSMTDEELALAITCPAEYDLNFSKNEKCNGEMSRNCYECSLKWLRAESEGRHGEINKNIQRRDTWRSR